MSRIVDKVFRIFGLTRWLFFRDRYPSEPWHLDIVSALESLDQIVSSIEETWTLVTEFEEN